MLTENLESQLKIRLQMQFASKLYERGTFYLKEFIRWGQSHTNVTFVKKDRISGFFYNEKIVFFTDFQNPYITINYATRSTNLTRLVIKLFTGILLLKHLK